MLYIRARTGYRLGYEDIISHGGNDIAKTIFKINANDYRMAA